MKCVMWATLFKGKSYRLLFEYTQNNAKNKYLLNIYNVMHYFYFSNLYFYIIVFSYIIIMFLSIHLKSKYLLLISWYKSNQLSI